MSGTNPATPVSPVTPVTPQAAALAELVAAEPVFAGPRPEPGPWDVVAATPALAPGSIRRATAIELRRPGGFDERLQIVLRGRDVRAGAGRTEVLDDIDVVVDAEEWTGNVVGIEGIDHPGVAALVGTSLRSGYGRAVAGALASDLAARTIVGSLFEDLGGALLVSGYASLRREKLPIGRGYGAERAEMQQDICAGWATGYELVELLRRDDISAVPIGPAAPALTAIDGWRGNGGPDRDRPPHTVTRVRTLDVAADPAGGVEVRAHFRDSYDGGGDTDVTGAMVMHEYLVHAHVAAGDDLAIERIAVEPRVLPWSRCPSAVASADRVVGVRLADLPGFIRADLVGTSTCTHLNSTLRSVADVAALVAHLP